MNCPTSPKPSSQSATALVGENQGVRPDNSSVTQLLRRKQMASKRSHSGEYVLNSYSRLPSCESLPKSSIKLCDTVSRFVAKPSFGGACKPSLPAILNPPSIVSK